MAYELVAEVLDHAPAGLTAAERLVMVVIAEYVLSSDYARGLRTTSRPAGDVARRAGLKPEGLKATLQRLAGRNLELRVALATGRDGRPVYAMPGRSTTYQVPVLAAINGGTCVCEDCQQIAVPVIPKGGSQPRLTAHKGGSQPRLGGATAPPNRGRNRGNPGPRTRARATPTDLDTIVEEMLDHAEIRITVDDAAVIYRDVLDRAGTPPRHPLSYVLQAIRAEPHRYRPTPTPPPAPRQLPLVASVDTDPPAPRPPVDREHIARGGWRSGTVAANGTDG